MLYPNTVNKEQIRRWSSEDGLFSTPSSNFFLFTVLGYNIRLLVFNP